MTIDSDIPLTTQTISGDQLADLPDNEDDLVAYLLQLAGMSGAAGSRVTFFIDGFTGGRLPPKDQIQQIIIDNNPFLGGKQRRHSHHDHHAARNGQMDRAVRRERE